MADEIVSRKDLLRQIDKIKLDDWIRAAEKLGLEVTQSGKGSSHYAIRKPGYAKEDLKGLITVVYAHLHKQDKPKCLKRLIVKGEIAEDNVWKALGLLQETPMTDATGVSASLSPIGHFSGISISCRATVRHSSGGARCSEQGAR